MGIVPPFSGGQRGKKKVGLNFPHFLKAHVVKKGLNFPPFSGGPRGKRGVAHPAILWRPTW